MTEPKIVYQTDYTGDGRYVGPVEAEPDPMEEGRWLVPAGAVETAPPKAEAPAYARWTGETWEVFTPPAPAPEPVPDPQPLPPIELTVGQLLARFDPESEEEVGWYVDLDDRMGRENALVRRQWSNPANKMTEGVGLWNIVVRHLEAIGIPAERRADLMSRSGASVVFADEPMAA